MNKWNMLVVNEKLSQSVCLAPTPEKIEEYELYKKHFNELYEEIERLNNIIKRLEEDLREMYLTFGEFSEEYTEKRIKELKGDEK